MRRKMKMPKKKLLLEDIVDELIDTDTELVDLPKLIAIHEKLKVAKKYEKIVGDAIVNRLISGETVEGYTLTKTKPRAKFADNEATVNKLIDFIQGTRPEALTGLGYGDVLAPKSITDLKKVLGEDLFDEILAEYVVVAEEGDNYTYVKLDETNN